MVRWCGWWAILAPGCTGGGVPGGDSAAPEEEGCTAQDIELSPGTGTAEYLPLSPGDPVVMVHGPQGGWHVETAALVRYSEPEVSVHPRVVVPSLGDLEIVGQQEPSFVALVGYDDTTCEGTFFNVRGFLDTDQGAESAQDFVCSLEGQSLTFEVTVSDIVSGRAATASVEVTAALDPVDVAPCGRR